MQTGLWSNMTGRSVPFFVIGTKNRPVRFASWQAMAGAGAGAGARASKRAQGLIQWKDLIQWKELTLDCC